MKRYTAHVTESYTRSYAIDAPESLESSDIYDIVNDLINSGEVDPTNRGEYDRTIDVNNGFIIQEDKETPPADIKLGKDGEVIDG